MRKGKIIVIVLIVGLLILAFILTRNNAVNIVNEIKEEKVVEVKRPDVKNMTYDIEGEIFKLQNGKAENEPVEGFLSKTSLLMFGEPVYGDLDGDKDEDVAVWFINDGGGTGKFHYAVFVMNNGGEFKPTNAVFLGDRVAPQTLEIKDSRAVYNFADRKPDEPMVAEPTVGKSVWVKFNKTTGEISI